MYCFAILKPLVSWAHAMASVTRLTVFAMALCMCVRMYAHAYMHRQCRRRARDNVQAGLSANTQQSMMLSRWPGLGAQGLCSGERGAAPVLLDPKETRRGAAHLKRRLSLYCCPCRLTRPVALPVASLCRPPSVHSTPAAPTCTPPYHDRRSDTSHQEQPRNIHFALPDSALPRPAVCTPCLASVMRGYVA